MVSRPEKYECLKNALSYARGGCFSHRSKVTDSLKKAEEYSIIPLANSVKQKILGIYDENEPKRRDECIELALNSARGNSIGDKGSIEYCLNCAQEHSSIPLDKSVDNAWKVYKQNEPGRKYACLKIALNSARGNSIGDKGSINAWLSYAQEHSDMPIAKKVANYVQSVYNENEPRRKEKVLETALDSARRNTINDKESVKAWLKYAQDHSNEPLPEAFVKKVWQVYDENQPRRRDECLNIALKDAIRGDKGSMKAWLGYSKKYTSGLLDKIITSVKGLLIGFKYKLD